MDYDSFVTRLRITRSYLANHPTHGSWEEAGVVEQAADAIVALRSNLAAARADAARLRHDLNDMRAGHEVLARQLSISRELLVECAQAILPPWQNPDDPLWSLKSRIVSTFAGQQSIDTAIAGEKK